MRGWVVLAGISGALSVAMGAWAAHGLAADVVAQGWVQKGSTYQMTHALALLAARHLGARVASWLFGFGLVVFPGTLYLLALGAPDWLKTATPMGGMAFIGGWLALTYTGLKKQA